MTVYLDSPMMSAGWYHQGKPGCVDCTYNPTDGARVREVIETRISRRGDGKDDPIRIVTEYFCKCGQKLAEVDPGNFGEKR